MPRVAVNMRAGQSAPFGCAALDGVHWPLKQRDVPLGSTLTLSNAATGPVHIRLRSGYGVAFAYPGLDPND